jgi:hypothetical protein
VGGGKERPEFLRHSRRSFSRIAWGTSGGGVEIEEGGMKKKDKKADAHTLHRPFGIRR